MSVVSRVPRADLVLEEAKRRARGAGPAVALGEARGQLRARPFLRLGQPGLVLVKSAPSGSNGPIAPIDEAGPVVVLPASGRRFGKTVSTMQGERAHGGQIALISDREGLDGAGEGCLAAIELPKAHPLIAPLVYAVPVQLPAYHVARVNGTDLDQPRNLVKSVTAG